MADASAWSPGASTPSSFVMRTRTRLSRVDGRELVHGVAPVLERGDGAAAVLGAVVGATEREQRVELGPLLERGALGGVEQTALDAQRGDAAGAELLAIAGVGGDEVALGLVVRADEGGDAVPEQRADGVG